MKKLFTLIFASATGLGAKAQNVTMNHYDPITHLDGTQIMSGDTIEINGNEPWGQYVNLHFDGITSGDVNFRVVEIVSNSCSEDQLKCYQFPDPNFQSTCLYPNSTNYVSPMMNNIDFAAGDTLVMKPQGSFSCAASVHFRYFIRLDGVELDSFDIMVASTLTVGNIEKEVADMTAYPNPVNEILVINTTGIDHEVGLKITDILGKVVYNETVSPLKKIDVSEYKNGVYLITVSENSKVIRTRRIVVKH